MVIIHINMIGMRILLMGLIMFKGKIGKYV